MHSKYVHRTYTRLIYLHVNIAYGCVYGVQYSAYRALCVYGVCICYALLRSSVPYTCTEFIYAIIYTGISALSCLELFFFSGIELFHLSVCLPLTAQTLYKHIAVIVFGIGPRECSFLAAWCSKMLMGLQFYCSSVNKKVINIRSTWHWPGWQYSLPAHMGSFTLRCIF